MTEVYLDIETIGLYLVNEFGGSLVQPREIHLRPMKRKWANYCI